MTPVSLPFSPPPRVRKTVGIDLGTTNSVIALLDPVDAAIVTGQDEQGRMTFPSVVGWHPFAGSTVQIYVGFVALVVNLLVAVGATIALRAAKIAEGLDSTHPADYHADEGSGRLRPVADAPGTASAATSN